LEQHKIRELNIILAGTLHFSQILPFNLLDLMDVDENLLNCWILNWECMKKKIRI